MIGDNLTLGIVIVAALLDSINPCVFGALIFLIAFMTRVFNNKRMLLFSGLLYSLVVYVTYLLIGLGIMEIAINVGLANTFYWFAASIAIFAGLLEIKDYFWYGKGFTLQMIPGGAERLKYYTSKIEGMEREHPAVLVFSTSLLGFLVVLVELPCTGAPYFAILGLLAKGSYAAAIPLLLLYNFIFVLPLLIVILVAYFGISSDRLEIWRKKHRGLMRLGMGIFLILLGLYMIHSIYPLF